MLTRVRSGAVVGVDAVVVDVEVDMALGMPFFNVVGLPEGAVRESKVRVQAAIKNSGFELPSKRTTVNLAPADLKKESACFELPIALGVLASARLLESPLLSQFLFAGELSLDGEVKPVRGVLPLALAARDGGFRGVVVPYANAAEAALVDRIQVLGVRTLSELTEHLQGKRALPPWVGGEGAPGARPGAEVDMNEVRGQGEIKAALELAAAGGHNVLLCGPPGSGKTMLARRLPGILPPMAFAEALEVTKVWSVLGLLGAGDGLLRERPFRAPHHTISDAGLAGGGPLARPGELSMAHRGVLFLDELPEFRRNVLEVLRQPLEEGVVRLARANQNVVYPCEVMLVAAMNPCPCGYFNVPTRPCTCPAVKVADYHARISGPLLDRIDITLETRPVEPHLVTALKGDELGSAWYRARVEVARARQRERFALERAVFCNAQMGPRLLRKVCVLKPKARAALELSMRLHGFSARAHDRLLKLARSRADLEGHADIEEEDMLFVIGCRVLDRKDWLRTAPQSMGGPHKALFQRA